MYTWFCLKFCQLVAKLSQLRGGGTALPGLIMEKIHPNFTPTILNNLRLGVVVISGTNGKTSTTKILAQILEEQGLKVFTNRSGSNFLRGVSSELIRQSRHGRLEADIAVLELDEAHAIHFIQQVPPRYCLLLNIMPDQIDRYGSLVKVRELLWQIAQASTERAILNREDPHLASLAESLTRVDWFGYSEEIRRQFQSLKQNTKSAKLACQVELLHYNANKLSTFRLVNDKIATKFNIHGLYNHYNAIGAIAAAQAILKTELDHSVLRQTLSHLEPAFGRGEKFVINQSEVDLILIKNSSGFQMSLHSFVDDKADIVIAINDAHSDGRDISWLWDVDFSCLPERIHGTTGSRSKDMALRLKYDHKKVSFSDADVAKTIKRLLQTPSKHKQIYASYTAMLQIRKILLKFSKTEAQ